MGKRLGGDTAKTPDLNWPEEYSILYDVILSNKSGGRKEEGGTFVVTAFVFWSNCYVYWGPASWEVTGHLPAGGKWWINFLFFASFPHIAFPFLTKLPLPQPMSLSILFSSPVLLRRGSERVTGWGSGSQPRPTLHNRFCSCWLYSSKTGSQLIKQYSDFILILL